jgi:AcrR family transcriptional regulator
MLLDAAYEVFLERGFDDASMQAIAERAGVSKPVIYSCFAGKDELFTALVGREEQRILSDIARAIPTRAEDDLEGTVAQGITGFLRSVAESPDTYRIILLSDGGANAVIANRIQRGRSQVVRTLAPVAEDWLRRRGVEDPKTTGELSAYAIVGAAEGAARALLAAPDRFEPEAAGRTLARALVRGASGI